ncbi:MAG: hypothetical protein ED859_07100, partial [Desulfuromonadales bacterium]
SAAPETVSSFTIDDLLEHNIYLIFVSKKTGAAIFTLILLLVHYTFNRKNLHIHLTFHILTFGNTTNIGLTTRRSYNKNS